MVGNGADQKRKCEDCGHTFEFAGNNKLCVPCALLSKLGKLMRLAKSDQPGDVAGANEAITRTLAGADRDVVYAVVERIEKRKYSEPQALAIYQKGVAEGQRLAEGSADYSSFRNVTAHDEPSWHDIACECAARPELLRDDREREFVEHMVFLTVHGGRLSEKQANWLRRIWARR